MRPSGSEARLIICKGWADMGNRFFEGYIKPGRIFGNLYFVGTRPASTHVIDTGEGLILIDPGFPEALEQIWDNIRRVGLDPQDIRAILLSHGHYDHAGAAKAMSERTGAKIYIGAGDRDMVSGAEDSSLSELFGVRFTQFFTPDVLLEDRDTISLGNTEILCLATPGHTDGTMSFFFDVTDGKRCYRAGMFGGAGTNTLTRDFLYQNRLPLTRRHSFLSSIERLKQEKVEIFLGNHVQNNHTEAKLIAQEQDGVNHFLTPEEWIPFLNERKARTEAIIRMEEIDMQTTAEQILKEKIIMIVRGVKPDKILPLAEALWQGGIRLMECTYDASGRIPDEEIAQAIATLAEQFRGRMLIGAGTVLTPKQVALTAKAGGKFIISPDTNTEVIAETKKAGLISIPGALTPSEATLAHRSGADFVKLFPISGQGPDYVKALCAPLSHIRFLAVGGVNPSTAPSYLSAGACGVGMGVSASDKEALEQGDWEAITAKYRALVEQIVSV